MIINPKLIHGQADDRMGKLKLIEVEGTGVSEEHFTPEFDKVQIPRDY